MDPLTHKIDWAEPSQTGSNEVYTGTFADRGGINFLLKNYAIQPFLFSRS